MITVQLPFEMVQRAAVQLARENGHTDDADYAAKHYRDEAARVLGAALLAPGQEAGWDLP